MATLLAFGQGEEALAEGRAASLLARDTCLAPEGCHCQHPVLDRHCGVLWLQSDESGAFSEIKK